MKKVWPYKYTMEWSELTQYNNFAPADAFSRTADVQLAYENHKLEQSRSDSSVDEYIMKTLFINDDKLSFVPNAFPYDLAPNIQHWLLWLNPKYKSPEPEIVQLYVEDITGRSVGKDIVMFRNHSANTSVKKIIHYHVFMRFN